MCGLENEGDKLKFDAPLDWQPVKFSKCVEHVEQMHSRAWHTTGWFTDELCDPEQLKTGSKLDVDGRVIESQPVNIVAEQDIVGHRHCCQMTATPQCRLACRRSQTLTTSTVACRHSSPSALCRVSIGAAVAARMQTVETCQPVDRCAG